MLDTGIARLATYAVPDRSSGQRVYDLEKKQDWKGLVEYARERLVLQPDSADWEIITGYALLQQRNFAQAAAAFTRATRRSPEDVDGWNMLGESFRLSGDPQAAIRTLQHAATVSRTSGATYFLLGEAYRDTGRPDRAIEAYRESSRIDPEFPLNWYSLGLAYLQTGRREELKPVLEQLRSLSPELAKELEKTRDTPAPGR